MAVPASWLVGSFRLADDATIVVGGNDVIIPAGDYYLRHATTALSLIDVIEAGIAGEYTGATVRILKNRKVEIDLNGNSETLVIPSALQEALGFTSSPYAAATSRTAENVSTLLWSAGWPETTTRSPVGVLGRKVSDRIMVASATGATYVVTKHHTTIMADLSWSAVRQDRTWTTDEDGLPGEFRRFFDVVIDPGYRMTLYPNVMEDDASSDEVTWPDGLGPYVVPEPDYDWYTRFVAVTDSLGANIDLKCMVTSEYS